MCFRKEGSRLLCCLSLHLGGRITQINLFWLPNWWMIALHAWLFWIIWAWRLPQRRVLRCSEPVPGWGLGHVFSKRTVSSSICTEILSTIERSDHLSVLNIPRKSISSEMEVAGYGQCFERWVVDDFNGAQCVRFFFCGNGFLEGLSSLHLGICEVGPYALTGFDINAKHWRRETLWSFEIRWTWLHTLTLLLIRCCDLKEVI